MHANTHRGRLLTGWHRASWVAFWSLLASTSCCCSPQCSRCWGQGAPSGSAGSDHEPPLQWTCPKQITSLWVFAINEVSANSSNDIFAVSECCNGLLMAVFYIWSQTEQQQKEKKKKKVKANGLHLQITQNLAAKLSWLYVRKTKETIKNRHILGEPTKTALLLTWRRCGCGQCSVSTDGLDEPSLRPHPETISVEMVKHINPLDKTLC